MRPRQPWEENNLPFRRKERNGKVITRLIHSPSVDPWYNLALEEYLLDHVAGNEVILYLWQNERTVVIGKHQNAWKECDCKQLETDGGKLARRLSGGGAVYHDLGNLNFTFVLDRELYDLERQTRVILEAVRNLGIDAEFTGRNDLTAGGKKFSGNAFRFKAKSAYHHGTILVDTDFNNLVRYLRVSRDKITSKGAEVASVRSRVVNLTSLNPGLTVEAVKRSLEQSFTAVYDRFSGEIQIETASAELEKLYQKYASWEWRYGETPEFDIRLGTRFAWGEIELGLSVEDGYITGAIVYSDAMDCEWIEALSAVLKGLPFRKDALTARIAALAGTEERRIIAADLNEWLNTKNI
jgi:lipoate-protein ligase A